MQAIINMSIDHYSEGQGVSLDDFNAMAKQLKLIYQDRVDILFSKRQARKVMELTSLRCTEVVPPPDSYTFDL